MGDPIEVGVVPGAANPISGQQYFHFAKKRFNATVDAKNRIIKLTVRLSWGWGDTEGYVTERRPIPENWRLENGEAAPPKNRAVAFLDRLAQSVTSFWDNPPFRLVPPALSVFNFAIKKFTPRLSVLTDGGHLFEGGAHCCVLVGRSRSDPEGKDYSAIVYDSTEPAGHFEMRLHEDDCTTSRVLTMPAWNGEQHTQLAAWHEFGHLLGLKHPQAQFGNGPDSYGLTKSERAEVMGAGSTLVARHMDPWLGIAKEFGKKVIPAADMSKNDTDWKVVPKGDSDDE